MYDVRELEFSAAIRRGLIEALDFGQNWFLDNAFSAAIRRGLIEATLRR